MAEGKHRETERIGRVTLDLTHYSGMDLYCDGSVEDELLDIVKKHRKDEFPQIIEEKKSWPILYHLSEQRSNIIEWIPMNHTEKVLEVGSGCGAITGMLAEKAASVTCVDLSKKRCEINAHRNEEAPNITIHVGNFREIEPDLDRDFDYIFLIGVFEYGQGYIGGQTPYETFLKMLQGHLRPGGRIVIAIENRTGLKYFAGSMEDHLGTYFTGIEGYPKDSVVRTFTRNGLCNIFRHLGITDYHFYYPYPDYKLMTMMHSDGYLPGKGEFLDHVRNYDRDRLLFFNEKYAYNELIEDNMYPDFANSFEVIIGPEFPTVYTKYSNDRAEEFKIRTDIIVDKVGRKVIRKTSLTREAKKHVASIYDAYTALTKRYYKGDLEVNDCSFDADTGSALFSFVNGKPLSTLLDQCLENDDMDRFASLFKEYYRRISYHEEADVADYDLIFSNIMVNGPIWTIIDYEWTYGKQIPSKEIAFRALYNYVEEDERRRQKLDIGRMYEMLGLTDGEIARLLEEEADFQKYVTGGRKSMVEIWKSIGFKHAIPEDFRKLDLKNRIPDRIQIYRNYGDGYSEETSEYPEEEYNEEGFVVLHMMADENVQGIRLDPALAPCVVTLRKVFWNGDPVEESGTPIGIHPNGAWLSDDSIVFADDDPWIDFNLSAPELKRSGRDELSVAISMSILSADIAENLYQYQKEDELPVEEPKTTKKKRKLFGRL